MEWLQADGADRSEEKKNPLFGVEKQALSCYSSNLSKMLSLPEEKFGEELQELSQEPFFKVKPEDSDSDSDNKSDSDDEESIGSKGRITDEEEIEDDEEII